MTSGPVLGDRSFAVASPCIRNNRLPLHLHDSELALLEFRRLLKTHLFGWRFRRLVTVLDRFINVLTYLQLIINWPATIWGPAIVMVRVVRPSVCLSHSNISETSEIDVWLLGNSNRTPGGLPDSESAIKVAVESMVPQFWVSPGRFFR